MLASDGVWEFVKSQEAIDIVNTSLEEGTMKVRTPRDAATCSLGEETDGDTRANGGKPRGCKPERINLSVRRTPRNEYGSVAQEVDVQ